MSLDFNKSIILLTQNGSRAYGVHTPTSDHDYVGIAVPPVDYYIGLNTFDNTTDSKIIGEYHHNKEPFEGIIYELRKFVHLCISAQPNMWNALFCPEDKVVYQTIEGTVLRAQRQLFLSAQVHKSYGGYVRGYLHRLSNGKTLSHKDVMQMMRILAMYEEIICNGEVNVLRQDAETLMQYRRGEYKLNDAITQVSDRLSVLDSVKTALPDKPDFEKINQLTTMLVQSVHKRI